MRPPLFLALLVLLTAPASCPSAETADAAPKPVDEISQAGIQSAFQVLRSGYIRRDDLTFDELNRGALEGLLGRLDFGAELVRQNGPLRSPEGGLHSELIAPGIAYLRPQTYAEAEVSLMLKTLGEFTASKSRALILDLRSPALPGDFEAAAAVLDFFVPRGELLFKLKQMSRGEPELFISKTDAAWPSPVVLLIDRDTNNIGEAVAAVLKDRRRAVLVGAPTRGATVLYETVPVDDKWSLRFAHAEMVLPDGGAIFRHGVQPHFRVHLDASAKQAIFRDSMGGSIKSHVFDEARLRYNEAALVARKNPELEDFIRRSSGRVNVAERPAVRDFVLQRAVDMLEATDFLDKATIEWNQATSSGAKEK